ncbi:MAG TPA: hypothetical protein VIY90_09515 [Steroidobacteraceae bacterium]
MAPVGHAIFAAPAPAAAPPAHCGPAVRLLPHPKSVFELNYVQTILIESVWVIAYEVVERFE